MMKKILIGFISTVLLLVPVAALDAGGYAVTGFGFQAPIKVPDLPFTLKNYEGLGFYLRQNMDTEGNYNFNFDASYLFSVSMNFKNGLQKPVPLSHIVDVNQCDFSFFFPTENGSTELQLGRFNDSDYTKIIFKQKIDGIKVAVDYRGLVLNFLFGYTGLLNTYTNPSAVQPKKYSNKLYSLAPAFVVANLDSAVPIGNYGHKLGFAFLSFTQAKKDPSYQFFITTYVNGQIITRLLFDISGTLGIRKFGTSPSQYNSLFITKLAYYFPQYQSVLGFKCLYASGSNEAQNRAAFMGFTKSPLSKVSRQLPSDIVDLGLYASVKPLDNLIIKMYADNYLKASKPQTKKERYQGFEWGAALNYGIRQNIYINADIGQLISHKGEGSFLGELSLILTF